MLESLVRRIGSSFGLEIARISAELSDIAPEFQRIVRQVRPFTMSSLERLATLCEAARYIVENEIPGAFVECGVWKGGSSMAAALAFLELGRKDIDLYLFDTFEGMSEPSEYDIDAATGERASDLLAASRKYGSIRAYAPIDEVRRNLTTTGYPLDRIHFIKGGVEKTIPDGAPDKISLLRLDTDWYTSTKHELIHLFPRLSTKGVLIIDDYGHWAGSRKAVDEYFATKYPKPLLHRIDYTGRSCVKF